MSSHAVVVGAGFAGLCAARVLSRVFDRVTVVERDRLPSSPEDRPGIPQGRHVHALLARGLVERPLAVAQDGRRLSDADAAVHFRLHEQVVTHVGGPARDAEDVAQAEVEGHVAQGGTHACGL